jgi:hypothetical protein
MDKGSKKINRIVNQVKKNPKTEKNRLYFGQFNFYLDICIVIHQMIYFAGHLLLINFSNHGI